ncbi:uncharacterized protein A1O5_03586 [Cladophialophora psammophila CBS 110553]|uniref:N-acetyltransferase domain-containing protein n=1 Tax=Cladophialophora psammophila CBS 110553 TaxID=1182543 RepID=W9XU67_9EURO|nr:uncharacterized protein A1O5_03586 [Cladophialophora psammophila CBS 110553]EXJ73824.1 hypothetical protein A1O5_03586 [Cladophialophora psammophila CBS 110553]
MVLRFARCADLPIISEIFALGFHDEEVVGPLLHPYRDRHPKDYFNYWRRRCRERYWDYSRVFLVSSEKDVTTGSEVVVGVAEWQRVGFGWDRFGGLGGFWDLRKLIRPLISAFHRILSLWSPNRAAAQVDPSDPFPLTPTTMERSLWPFVSYCYLSPPHRQTRWSLECISVLPEYRKSGHGRDLVAWGLERAREEGIPASVMGAADKERFYQRCGFTEIAGWANDGIDDQGRVNPLKGRIKGGCILYTRVQEDDEWERNHPQNE